MCEIFSKVGAHPLLKMSFFGAKKLTLGGITSILAIASDHPGACTSMPHPCLAQKTFLILKKGWPDKKLFLAQQKLVILIIHNIIQY